jgi:hypothetical protein
MSCFQIDVLFLPGASLPQFIDAKSRLHSEQDCDEQNDAEGPDQAGHDRGK